MHSKIRILWADDEMELLKAHLLFLEEKGYEVVGVSNGYDALDALQREQFDVVFLDEPDGWQELGRWKKQCYKYNCQKYIIPDSLLEKWNALPNT